MTVTIADIAKEFGLKPGHVYSILDDLGVSHDALTFEADNDALELIREALPDLKGSTEIVLPPNRTPRDIALALDVAQPEIQKTLMMKMKVMATLTTALKPEVAEQLIRQFGYSVRWSDGSTKPLATAHKKPTKQTGAQHRPPVVTIMGHVDHGKTSLLDYIRKANVAGKEHGGITQHIGAYQVELPEGKITFLDTPGHAAFTNMRARGAQVTDIAILVVAADDGIMPQTAEAISHIKNAKVPMIVAVNKCDKPGANPERTITQLTEYEVVPEAFGGDTPTVNVSALTGAGVKDLLEVILLQAEVMELKADPKGSFTGVVIEAKLEKGRGPVATILVEEGTLLIGDMVIAGNTYGRIKAMTDYTGERITEAGPSTPVEILGLNDVPSAGDKVVIGTNERSSREIAGDRADKARVKGLATPSRGITLADLRKRMNEDEIKDLNLVVKGDVQGSVEAVRGMLEKIANEEVTVKVIHSGVGTITESDILLASAANAICVGFNVKPEGGAKKEAERRKVEIRTYTIIYELIEDIEKAIHGMLEPKFVEEYQGTVEIRMVFNLTRYGLVAGSHCTDGKITRNSKVRVKRDKDIVYDGKVASLKHVKEDVKEITNGFDCGVQFDGWTGFKAGDVIEAFELVQIN